VCAAGCRFCERFYSSDAAATVSYSLIMRREDKISEEIQSRRESSSERLSQAVPSERVLISQTPAANMNMQPAERARMTNCRLASGATVCALCNKQNRLL